MIQIRRGHMGDMQRIWEMSESFSVFHSKTISMMPTEKEFVAKLELLIKDHVVLVAENIEIKDGVAGAHHVVGFIVGILAPHFFRSEVMQLTELLWWVDEEYRGSRAGAYLLHAFINVGRHHAHRVIMTIEEQSPVNPEVLTKRGFNPLERNFVLEVP